MKAVYALRDKGPSRTHVRLRKQSIDGLILSNTVRAGLTGWAKAVATEVAADNVTVNNVDPGYTLTERQEELAQARSQALGNS